MMARGKMFLWIGTTFLFLCIPNIDGGEFFRWFALIPLIFLIKNNNFSRKKLIFLLWLVGFLFLLFQYSVFLNLFPLDWIGITQPVVGFLLTCIIWIFLSAVGALPFILFFIARKNLILFPFLWILQEYIRALLYSLVTWGSSSFLGDTFTYGFLGYTAHTSNILLALAPYAHLYGLSFLFATANVIFFYAIQTCAAAKKIKKLIYILPLIVILLIVEFLQITHTPPKETDKVSVIALQGNNPFMFGYTQEYFNNSAEVYKKGLTEGLKQHPETSIIVIPEASQFIRTISRNEKITPKAVAVELLPSDRYHTIIYGDYDSVRNSSFVVATSNDLAEDPKESQKLLLMPLGEYQPYLVEFTSWLLGKREWFDNLLFYRNLNLPNKVKGVISTKVGSFYAVSCSEVFAGATYRHISETNPDFIVHLQRLASFHGNTRVFYEGLRVSKFRAAELRKQIIGAVDGGGYSYIIDSYGKIISIGNKDSLFVHGTISIAR